VDAYAAAGEWFWRGYKAALEKAAEELEATALACEKEATVKIPGSGTEEVIAVVRACAEHLRKMRVP
jgi:hypothetical protein